MCELEDEDVEVEVEEVEVDKSLKSGCVFCGILEQWVKFRELVNSSQDDDDAARARRSVSVTVAEPSHWDNRQQ